MTASLSSPYIYNVGASFRAIVSEHTERSALAYPSGDRITYGELDALSNQIARLLLESGVRRHGVVAIFNEKSPRALASMIACLKIGAIYTNLDITSPWSRIEKMFRTCSPDLVLYDRLDPDVLEGISGAFRIRALALSENETVRQIDRQSSEGLDATLPTGQDPAYIMFTSGSTGFPKGAVMSHANVLNFVRWGQQTFRVTPADRFTNVNPMYFDNSVFDFYTALLSGATLCPLTADPGAGIRNLVDSVNRLGCTIWFSVPSLLVYLLTTKALREDDFPSVTRIVFGGEGFPKPKLKQLYALFGDRSRLVNVYGPTECTCICSSYDISPRDFEDLADLAPLGPMAPNFDYIIDPVDSADPSFGELYLGGPNVGLGYYGDPERTSRSFVQDPTNSKFRRVMYRTGDLVREDKEGFLRFCGRADNQIKHMGYRIELEEIEAALNSLHYVEEAAVVYKRLEAGLGQIVAFVNTSAELGSKDISEDVRKTVPAYMAPKKITIMRPLPKNRNGKIDRVRLLTEA